MPEVQEKVEQAIRETLKDEHGAGSDLRFVQEDRTGPWVYVEGNLDVQHLASVVIAAVEDEDEYEYGVLRTDLSGELGRPQIVGLCWSTREEVNESLLGISSDRVIYKIVKRLKAGRIEDV
jgi:hypothetical protein